MPATRPTRLFPRNGRIVSVRSVSDIPVEVLRAKRATCHLQEYPARSGLRECRLCPTPLPWQRSFQREHLSRLHNALAPEPVSRRRSNRSKRYFRLRHDAYVQPLGAPRKTCFSHSRPAFGPKLPPRSVPSYDEPALLSTTRLTRRRRIE